LRGGRLDTQNGTFISLRALSVFHKHVVFASGLQVFSRPKANTTCLWKTV
jgi:hypothetical protein